MITQDRMEKALKYLAETDDQLASLKTDAERYAYVAKKTKAAIFLHSGKKTIAERQAEAENSDEYGQAMDNYFKANREAESIAGKRKTEALVLECWRSLNSNRRAGFIT